jgi:hypothetical protein
MTVIMILLIKKPDITKKISTPTNPPEKKVLRGSVGKGKLTDRDRVNW